ncbi:MAG: hypothetical protein ACK4IU_15735 [Tabrizicola flagellatus]
MNDLLRRARALRCEPGDPGQAFRHRVGVGLAIAVLIFVLSLLR